MGLRLADRPCHAAWPVKRLSPVFRRDGFREALCPAGRPCARPPASAGASAPSRVESWPRRLTSPGIPQACFRCVAAVARNIAVRVPLRRNKDWIPAVKGPTRSATSGSPHRYGTFQPRFPMARPARWDPAYHSTLLRNRTVMDHNIVYKEQASPVAHNMFHPVATALICQNTLLRRASATSSRERASSCRRTPARTRTGCRP
jgi:hypothetical protein